MNKIVILFLFLFSILILSSSCSIEKRKHQTGYHIEWRNNKTESSKKDNFARKEINCDALAFTATNGLAAEMSSPNSEPQFIEDNSALASNDTFIHLPSSKNKSSTYYSNVAEPGNCDNIILVNGEEIEATVTEVGTEEIRYKKCNIPDSPVYVLKRSEVFMIKYQNGTKDIIKPANKPASNLKTEGFGLVSFIVGACGIIIAGLPFGFLALIFGAISLNRFKKEPGKYKGKGFAITGIVLGLLSIIAVLFLLAIFL